MFTNPSRFWKRIPLILIVAALLLSFALLAFLAGQNSGARAQGGRILGRAAGAAVSFRLSTSSAGGRLAFVGAGGDLEGQVNPDLQVRPGDWVEITLVNGGGLNPHNLAVDGLGAVSKTVTRQGQETRLAFTAGEAGVFAYYDALPGHRYAGMEGRLIVGDPDMPAAEPMEHSSAAAGPAASPEQAGDPAELGEPEVSFRLLTAMAEGRMVFTGVDGELGGQVNPELRVEPGQVVEVILENGDGVLHNLALPDLDLLSADVTQRGEETRLVFKADQPGTFAYFCAIPGHRQAGMEGLLVVGEPEPAAAASAAPSISRRADDLPGPLARTNAEHVRVDLETVEVEGRLADGTTYTFWTFNGLVPGPFVRVRAGDTVEVRLKNAAGSGQAHSVDFHAVTGPGGGAVATQTQPGGETTFTFKALNPGLYVYHCATPMVAHHITNGMYGLILVEPEGGLPEVDREFYVMQGEIYTNETLGQAGAATFSLEKLLDEDPEYFVLNGAVGALAGDGALQARVGETVRIFYGVGGPNFTSSFHVIGEIFDRVYDQASLTAAPLTDVQTTLVPAGGAAVVEFELQVPGRYILVDHALSRLERGLAGFLMVDGPPDPEIFAGEETAGSGH